MRSRRRSCLGNPRPSAARPATERRCPPSLLRVIDRSQFAGRVRRDCPIGHRQPRRYLAFRAAACRTGPREAFRTAQSRTIPIARFALLMGLRNRWTAPRERRCSQIDYLLAASSRRIRRARSRFVNFLWEALAHDLLEALSTIFTVPLLPPAEPAWIRFTSGLRQCFLVIARAPLSGR